MAPELVVPRAVEVEVQLRWIAVHGCLFTRGHVTPLFRAFAAASLYQFLLEYQNRFEIFELLVQAIRCSLSSCSRYVDLIGVAILQTGYSLPSYYS